MSDRLPSAALLIREHHGRPFYEAKFRHAGRQVMRRVGPAWIERDSSGAWVKRRGRVQGDHYDERGAHLRAAELVGQYVKDAADAERVERERKARGVTFRELATEYLVWLENVKGAKPSTLRDHRLLLAEPGTPYKRGSGTMLGEIMKAIGNKPAVKITRADVRTLLNSISARGASPRNVNKHRQLLVAIFNHAIRDHGLTHNPAAATDKRREPAQAVLVYYLPEEIEALARAFEDGVHRRLARDRTKYEITEDHQDADAVRIAAYCGLRLGELLALRWSDIDFAGSVLTVSRAISVGRVGATKSGRIRQVPLSDQAASAFDRLSRRANFTTPADLVFCSSHGRQIDGSALRRRFKRARDAEELRPLRWHDLRHTFGSLLVAGGVDLVSVKDALGHAHLTTTSRYLHARPAHERAAAFTAAFGSTSTPDAVSSPENTSHETLRRP